MSPALDGYLLIDEGEVIVGGNIVDDAPEALNRDVLGYMGLLVILPPVEANVARLRQGLCVDVVGQVASDISRRGGGVN